MRAGGPGPNGAVAPSGGRRDVPEGWVDLIRFCPACGAANDQRSLACGYRDADDQVVYWWCHCCGFEALLAALRSMVVEVVESELQASGEP